MGAGKTTFSRKLLECLGVRQPPEGSPSFAIAHEYTTRSRLEVVHVDFYRIRSEDEIAEAGIEAYFWEREAIVIAEWTSLWPEFEAAVLKSSRRRSWRVSLAFVDEAPERRQVVIVGPEG
jgi:tRNA threonylcarbamoyl adenosine modification protein YjeE